MKTVKEWLETLDEPYRSQALENLDEEYGDMIEPNLAEALWGAFVWDDTPQGNDYWRDFVWSLRY